MKYFFSALKKMSKQKQSTYVNSDYKLIKKEKQSLWVGLVFLMTPIVISFALMLIS
jgi:hypothetical protein